MRADEYIAIEQHVTRAHRALGNLCDSELRKHLNTADSILAEVRHYAVAVADIRETEMSNDERIALIREAEDRLLRFVAPTRL